MVELVLVAVMVMLAGAVVVIVMLVAAVVVVAVLVVVLMVVVVKVEAMVRCCMAVIKPLGAGPSTSGVTRKVVSEELVILFAARHHGSKILSCFSSCSQGF